MQRLTHFILTFCLLISSLAAHSESKTIRIVSLTPSQTDIVIELGATNQLVGVLEYGKRRPEVKDIAAVGKFRQFSLEKLINLKPDLILLTPSTIKPIEQQRLVDLGYKIIESDSHSLDELATQIVTIATAIGKEQQGQALAEQIRTETAQLRKKYFNEKPRTVFYQVWDNPIYTLGKNQIISDALRLCGTKNIFEDIDIPAPQVNIETVVARNPDIIISSNPAVLDSWRKWSNLTAVKNHQLILFNNEQIARPSFGMLAATQQLCQAINDKP